MNVGAVDGPPRTRWTINIVLNTSCVVYQFVQRFGSTGCSSTPHSGCTTIVSQSANYVCKWLIGRLELQIRLDDVATDKSNFAADHSFHDHERGAALFSSLRVKLTFHWPVLSRLWGLNCSPVVGNIPKWVLFRSLVWKRLVQLNCLICALR